MKLSQVFLFWLVSAPLLLAARCLQRFYMIDGQTGFFVAGLDGVGMVIVAAFLVFGVAVLVLCRLDGAHAVERPDVSAPMAVGSFVASGFLLVSALWALLDGPANTRMLTALVSLAFALSLVWRGVALLGKASFPMWMAPMGTLYAVIRLVIRFAAYADEVMVSDSIFDILTMCLLVLFFFAEGKTLAGLKSERLPSSLTSWALVGAVFCLSEWIPAAVNTLLGGHFTLYGNGVPDPAYIGFSVFLLLSAYPSMKRASTVSA